MLKKLLRVVKICRDKEAITYKASTTIELSMMMPIVLLVITAVINGAFYYHDKNVIYGKVYEVGAVAQQQERLVSGIDSEILEEYYQNSIGDKLLIFSDVTCHVEETTTGVRIMVAAEKGIMALKIEKEYKSYYPEQNVRWVQS